MKILDKKYIILVLLIPIQMLLAQDDFTLQIQNFQQQRMSINQTAMIVLGSWAAGNILVGGYGNFNAKNEVRYFHQFNAFWNVVNLGIAAFGYMDALHTNPLTMSNTDIVKDFYSLQNFLLLNAGLDVAYISIGLFLREKARNSSHYHRLRGYGNSLLVQGGFLFVFDVVLFFIHQNNATARLYPHMDSILNGGAGLGIQFNF